MAKIIKLDKNLANQIAAWEVVERPISVIKELIENSIDAWATNIKIEIIEWWKKLISIIDNWIWIDNDDLKLVVEKYSTSKIKNLDDLYNVMTFWFRWEAMASISSVSKMSIFSNNLCLKVIWWEQTITQVASNKWTKILVEDLFYNTPARLNYLKKERTEYNHILSYLYEIALSYPKIGFEFISDSKQVFLYREKEDLKTRIYNIYSKDFSDNLIKINFEMVWMQISWYISDPKISFNSKNKQNIFVNKRPIKSYMISKSISDAYNRFIPHWQHWSYVLNLQIDPTQIDVNVHPRKLEVRFANEQSIFKAFYHTIQEKLESVSIINTNSEKTWFLNHSTITNSWNINTTTSQSNQKYYTWSWTKFKSYSPYKDTNPNPNQWQINNALNFSKELLNNNNLNNFQNNKIQENLETSNDLHYTSLWKIIWQAHNSYIIVETSNWIKFLDQHALAERIIYEKLTKKNIKISTQWLLIWESVSLMPKEINILKDNMDTFKNMWFDFEIMPWSIVIINWIPDFIKKENLNLIFWWILDDIWEYNFSKSKCLEEVQNKIFAYTACRSAIKFGHKLNLFEMNKLLNDSILDYSSTCPHWRPSVFDINLNELKDKYER